MFGKGEHKPRRSSGSPFIIFRLMISLVMFCILLIGAYQAFKYFSGVDPVKADPQSLVLSLVSSKDASAVISQIFSLKIPTNLSDLKAAASNPQNLVKNNSNASALNLVQTSTSRPMPQGKQILKFALVTDSHNNNDGLKQALAEAKQKGAKFAIGLGDWSNVGTEDELKAAKAVFDDSGLPYYVTAGDHDLWDGRDKGGEKNATERFTGVFGTPYQSFGDSGIRFIILFNSDNYKGVDEVQMSWLQTELSKAPNYKAVYIFTQEPLTHPSSDHVMGKTTPALQAQAQQILSMMQQAGVKGAFYGDTHFYGEYVDPKTNIPMTTIGALAIDRNAQRPRYALVDVYEDGNYNIQDVELP